MKKLDLFGFQVEVDERLTRQWYEKSNEWNCDCEDCKYFIAFIKNKKLPLHISEILKKLGIMPEKATYVCEIVREKEEILYQFSYRIAGNILRERESNTNNFEWGDAYCRHEIYPYGAIGFPNPHFDLEFWIRIPASKDISFISKRRF